MGSGRGGFGAGRRSWVVAFAVLLLACLAVPAFASEPVPVGSSESSDFIPPTPDEEEFEALAPDGQDIAKALAEHEQQERERQEWLKTPEAVRQREDSRLGFAGISPSASEELFRAAFPRALEALNSDPSRFLSDAKLVRTLGDSGAVVKDEGEGSLLETTVPVRTEDEEGKLAKVDLSLKATAGGFETDNAIADLRLPDSADKGMEVGEAGVEISQAGATNSAARRYGDKNLFYPDALPDTDLLASATSFGLELYDQLRSEDSPEELRFHIDVRNGAELRSDGRGGAEVLREGKRLTLIPKPFAKDAQGTDVPLKSEVEGSALVVHITHREGDYAYPILVDPIVEDWVNQGENWYGGNNWGALSNGAWQWERNNSNIGKPPDPEHEWEWERCCWEGSHAGLLIDMRAAFYGPEQWGEWIYSTPNEHVYINHVWLIPFNRADEGCGSAAPHDYHGLWNPGGVWSPIWFDYAKSYGNNSSDGVGRKLVIGETSSSTGVWLACDRILYAGGVGIWLEDDYPPVIHSVSVPSGGWFGDQKPTNIDVSAGDEGLGVQFVKVLDEGKGVVYKDEVGNCTGLYGARCPTEHESHAEVTGDSFGEGIRGATATVSDPTGKVTESHFTTMVNNSPPEVALHGQLAEATKTEVGFTEGEPDQSKGNDKLRLPVYNLHINARDGNPKGTDLEKRSGVKDVKVKLDGEEKEVPWKPLSECPETSCERDVVYPLDLTEIETGGVHKLEVIAEDFVGEKNPRHIEFEYIPATGMKDEYVMQHFPLPDGQGSEEDEEHPARPELAVNVMNGNLVYRQRDVNVEGPNVNLGVERFYNSQLPASENTEWGDGWTLAQTPKLEPDFGEEVPSKGDMVRTSGAIQSAVGLPTESGAERFDPELQATITKEPGGGYAVADESGETDDTLAFNSSGKVTELRTPGYAKIDYGYEEGNLAEIAVDDPGSAGAPTEPPEGEGEFEEAEEAGETPVYDTAFGSYGSENGQLKSPGDVALDSEGNVWVADKGNNRIEEFDSEGNFLSKFGTAGSGNGQLSIPTSLAIDVQGSIWVTERGNNRVQEFSPSGEYLAKFGSYGTGNGQFHGPEGIAIDAQGHIWVSDTYSGRVQEFDSEGNFIRVVGSYGSGEGQIGEPTGIDVNAEGDVWIADWQNNRVETFDGEGNFIRQFGSSGTGDGQFNRPDALAIDAKGNVWVGDQNNGRVQRFDLDGDYVNQFGSKGSGEGQFSFTYPMGLEADSKGNVWIADVNNNRIQRWTIPAAAATYTGVLYDDSFGSQGTGNGQFGYPGGVALGPDGSLWVADYEHSRVEHFDRDGEYLGQFGEAGSGNGQIESPVALAADPQGNVWVATLGNGRIEEFDEEGEFVSQFGAESEVGAPLSMSLTPAGHVVVGEIFPTRLREYSQTGELLKTIATNGGEPGQVGVVTGIATTPDGSIWVSDYSHGRVERFDAEGQFVSQFGSEGSGPGQFEYPGAISADANGNLWVVDQGNNRVELFDEEGNYVLQFGEAGSEEGQLNLSFPTGIAADNSHDIWVSDAGGDRVQKWVAGTHVPNEEELEPNDPSVEVEVSGGLVNAVQGEKAGTHSYSHEGDDLTAYSGPEGETHYEYDSVGRMTKVTLPHGTWAEIAYFEDGRVESIKVSVEGDAAKTSYFHYKDDSPRRTTVELPDAPHVVYDIGDDGSVLKWWNEEAPPTLDLSGALYDNREKDGAIWSGTHVLDATAESAEGIASINIVLNGDTVVHELTCEQDHENEAIECERETAEWIAETDLLTPGHLQVEVIATDALEHSASERFWVNIPPPPPPLANGTPVEPKFRDIKKFREEYGLEVVFPVKSEIELNERIFNLINAWNEPNTPAGEVARASTDRWGVPLRPQDVAELEYRERYLAHNGPLIAQWGESEYPTTYAGYYMDHRAGGKIRVGFTENMPSRVADLQAQPDLEAVDRLSAFPTEPAWALMDLHGSAGDFRQAVASHPEITSLLTTTGVDVKTNQLRVGATDTGAVGSFISEHLGAASSIAVVFDPNKPARQFDELHPRERFLNGRVVAGDRILAELACTLAFGAWERGTNPATGALALRNFALTAGHCGNVGEDAYVLSREPGDHHVLDPYLGKIARNAYLIDQAGAYSDMAAIRLVGNRVVPRWFYWSSGSQSMINGEAEYVPGGTLCHSGASTGTQCGPTEAEPVEVWFEDNPWPDWQLKVDMIGQHGDSGAPVVDPMTGSAVGIHVGGKKTTVGANEVSEYSWVQPLMPLEGPEYPQIPAGQSPGLGAAALSPRMRIVDCCE